MNNAQVTYLDVLRGFAAQLVLLGHIYSMVLFPGETLALGDLGVIIFFILSGFLISYTSFSKANRGGYTFGAYLMDRSFRIFVPYLPAVVFIAVLDFCVYSYTDNRLYFEHYVIKDLIATLSMLQQHPIGLFAEKLLGISQFKLSTFGSARPLWTVAIEWWLYIVFGLALFFSNKSKNLMIFFAILLLSAIVPLFNSVAGTGEGLSLVWLCMACLAIFYFKAGAAVQKKASEFLRAEASNRYFFFGVVSAVFFLMVVRVFWTSYIEQGFIFDRPVFYDFNLYVLIAIFLAMVFVALGLVSAKARNPLALFVADYSYSLYLIHYSLIFFLFSFGFYMESKFANLLIYYVVCNGVAIVFWWMFERHHHKLRLVFGDMVNRRYGQL